MTRGSSVFIGFWNLFCTQQWLSAGLNIKAIKGIAYYDLKIRFLGRMKFFTFRSVRHICHFGNFKCDQWGAQKFNYKYNCKYKYKIQSFGILSGTSAVHMLHPAAFCHPTMDGIGNDLCNRRRSLFFPSDVVNSAIKEPPCATFFILEASTPSFWWIVTVSCLFAISFGEKRVFGHGPSLSQVGNRNR